MSSTSVPNARVVSAQTAQSSLEKMLHRVKSENERFLIQRQGEPEAVLMSYEDYLALIAPAPEALNRVWEAAERQHLDEMTPEEIDNEIAESRRENNRAINSGANQ